MDPYEESPLTDRINDTDTLPCRCRPMEPEEMMDSTYELVRSTSPSLSLLAETGKDKGIRVQQPDPPGVRISTLMNRADDKENFDDVNNDYHHDDEEEKLKDMEECDVDEEQETYYNTPPVPEEITSPQHLERPEDEEDGYIEIFKLKRQNFKNLQKKRQKFNHRIPHNSSIASSSLPRSTDGQAHHDQPQQKWNLTTNTLVTNNNTSQEDSATHEVPSSSSFNQQNSLSPSLWPSTLTQRLRHLEQQLEIDHEQDSSLSMEARLKYLECEILDEDDQNEGGGEGQAEGKGKGISFVERVNRLERTMFGSILRS